MSKPKILKIAGTNGSGKSTIAHTLLARYPSVAVRYRTAKRSPDKPVVARAQVQGEHVLVIGSYANQCGGCDGIQPYSDILEYVNWCVENYPADHVLMEGLLIAGRGSLGELFDSIDTHEAIYATMDTPLEVCVGRVNARRAAKGKGPLENLANLEAKYFATHRSHSSLIDQGFDARLLDHTQPVKSALKMLGVRINKEPRHA